MKKTGLFIFMMAFFVFNFALAGSISAQIYKYSGYICYWCFGTDTWECPSHPGYVVVGMTNPYGGTGNDGNCCCPTGLYDTPQLVDSCDHTSTYYCTYQRDLCEGVVCGPCQYCNMGVFSFINL